MKVRIILYRLENIFFHFYFMFAVSSMLNLNALTNFYSRKSLTLEKHCLSFIYIANLFQRKRMPMTMQGANFLTYTVWLQIPA